MKSTVMFVLGAISGVLVYLITNGDMGFAYVIVSICAR